MPTTSLSNIKLNFAIDDGSSSATKFGVVYSVDRGENWIVLDDYTSASHWNTYVDANYDLDADNKDKLIIRLFIQSATKTSNYNLKYVNILADDTSRYQEQFSRVNLDLGSNEEQEKKDTETRIKEFRSKGNDPGLVSNYFQFGRYLLISSSLTDAT